MGNTSDTWPAGSTYVFQGTIAEDATAGTHVCTLTLTPGTGSEFEVLYGNIKVGNTATAQSVDVQITDGTNLLGHIVSPTAGGTTANLEYNFPNAAATTAGASAASGTSYFSFIVSGAMTLVLKVTTAAVSVTQVFAVVCRIRGAKPTATLNDTIGTSTNTVNTDKVF